MGRKGQFIANSVVMYDAQLTQSLLNQAAFCWSKHQICTTNLNPLQYLRLEIFHLHINFQIVWMPIEMPGFHLQNFTEQL